MGATKKNKRELSERLSPCCSWNSSTQAQVFQCETPSSAKKSSHDCFTHRDSALWTRDQSQTQTLTPVIRVLHFHLLLLRLLRIRNTRRHFSLKLFTLSFHHSPCKKGKKKSCSSGSYFPQLSHCSALERLSREAQCRRRCETCGCSSH